MGSSKTQKPYIQYAFEKGLFTNESQDIIRQYLRFNLNKNHDDQDAYSSTDGDAEDRGE